MMPLPEHLEAALYDRDPLRRLRAVRAARADADNFFRELELQALTDLVALHNGNDSAAARELGVTSQGLGRKLKRATSAVAEQSLANQEQPALYFDDTYAAEDALVLWQYAEQELADHRDPLVLGALAAGLSPESVYRCSGIPLDVIRRLRPSGDIVVGADVNRAHEVLEATGRAMTAYAEGLRERARTPEERESALVWTTAADSFVRNAAPMLLLPEVSAEEAEAFGGHGAALRAWSLQDGEEDTGPAAPEIDGNTADVSAEVREAKEKHNRVLRAHAEERSPEPVHASPERLARFSVDAWLATEIAELRRRAARHTGRAPEPGTRDISAFCRAMSDVADVYTHLRATATVPPLPAVPAHQ
ncbi:helix-turn-helix domain-containing protein [Kitasatospora sp. NPDC088134]|uniref:helix-turn-helix domain-containing protein n=1 Tax=Kitasatospora sp. NPDC088134 TaxID=3364071 RepID=UPI00380A87A8